MVLNTRNHQNLYRPLHFLGVTRHKAASIRAKTVLVITACAWHPPPHTSWHQTTHARPPPQPLRLFWGDCTSKRKLSGLLHHFHLSFSLSMFLKFSTFICLLSLLIYILSPFGKQEDDVAQWEKVLPSLPFSYNPPTPHPPPHTSKAAIRFELCAC